VKETIEIGFIDGGQVEGAFAADLAHLTLTRRNRVSGLIRVQGNLLSRARNELVSTFLEGSRSHWLFMVDTDHRLPLESFDRMLEAAHAVKAPVVSALCFAAYPAPMYPMPVPAIYKDNGDGRWAAFHDYPPDQLVPVDAAGAGCLLMHRDALEAVRDQRNPAIGERWCWFEDGPAGENWVSEDLTFMQRLRAAGVQVHAHTGSVLPHIKRYVLTDEHHRDMLAAYAAEQGR
jgi:hypothetical protein